ncbi:uncharacterized protein LOC135163034 [Diachasmimorpha longicaudata]|uniref:uncharacterized protein LOC135163034 n=1 Tax=Diachasmimorpha longicaudata TaxID=58733 RepID=UPI0030B8D9FD
MEFQGAPTTWFNKRLFWINNQRMRFHLDGFHQAESYKIIRIAEAYGAEWSEVGEDVIIFSEPHRCSGIYESVFHVKYLYDCISSNCTQELSKYLLLKTSKNPSVLDKYGVITQTPLHKINNVGHISTVQKNIPTKTQLLRDRHPANPIIANQISNTITIKAEVHSEEDSFDKSTESPRCLELGKRKMTVGCSNCKTIWPSFSLIHISDSADDGQPPEKRDRSREASPSHSEVESQPKCSNPNYQSPKCFETKERWSSFDKKRGCARMRVYVSRKAPGNNTPPGYASGQCEVKGRYDRVTSIEMVAESMSPNPSR